MDSEIFSLSESWNSFSCSPCGLFSPCSQWVSRGTEWRNTHRTIESQTAFERFHRWDSSAGLSGKPPDLVHVVSWQAPQCLYRYLQAVCCRSSQCSQPQDRQHRKTTSTLMEQDPTLPPAVCPRDDEMIVPSIFWVALRHIQKGFLDHHSELEQRVGRCCWWW